MLDIITKVGDTIFKFIMGLFEGNKILYVIIGLLVLAWISFRGI